MRILGIDPGYAIVGFGLVDCEHGRFSPVEYGAVTTDAGLAMDARLEIIYNGVADVIRTYSPQCVSVERLYFTTNRTTAIAVAEARGVILLAARAGGVPVFEYTPLQVKQAVVGYGKAEKKQVMEMTRRILGLRYVPRPDDAADALAMAICHGNTGASALFAPRLKEQEKQQ